MAEQVFVGNGEKDPSLVEGDERGPQAGTPCPGYPPAPLQAGQNLTTAGPLPPLGISLGRGAQSRDDTNLPELRCPQGRL